MKNVVGRYFEDFTTGETFTSPARTVTEADIVMFSAISGDHNPLHTDAEFARTTPFGQRIAHGLLGLAMITGLMGRLGLFEGTAIAFLGLKWRFTAPIFIGDTVHVEMTISEKRETSNPERGVLVREVKLLNQRGEVVQEGTMDVMVRRRPAGEG
jgi:acyl dehydratase